MNIHVARTAPFRTAASHTCYQGQTSGLTVRPDAARNVRQASRLARNTFWNVNFVD